MTNNNDELKERLNDGEIGMRIGELLSHLDASEWSVVNELLNEGAKIDIHQVGVLRQVSAN